MNLIPLYPTFTEITAAHREEIKLVFSSLSDNMSEFTFANIFLHKDKYEYRVSVTEDGIYILTGKSPIYNFFITANGLPSKEVVLELLNQDLVWKLISPSLFEKHGEEIAEWGIQVEEDRNNADYLYLREELCELRGKRFHKKKNLVNAFKHAYEGRIEVKSLDETTKDDALTVLNKWNEGREVITDFKPATEALNNLTFLGLSGWIVYIDNEPVSWALGEPLGTDTFCVHFEKGLEHIKGVYQHVNMVTACNLSENYVYINREQDLGDEGLRQAKMTYRPCGFITKYIGKKI